MSNTSGFIFIYIMMGLLMLGDHLSKLDPPNREARTLDPFECTDTVRNPYDCKRFNLEKSGEYPFFFESGFTFIEPDISLKIYQQPRQYSSQNRIKEFEAVLTKLSLDSDGQVKGKSSKPITLQFECQPDQLICNQTQPFIREPYIPSGKHYYLLELNDHEALFQTIRHAEIRLEFLDQNYQRYVFYFKLVVLALVIRSTVFYFWSLKSKSFSVEQKWISILTVAVIALISPFGFLYYKYGIGLIIGLSNVLSAAGFGIIMPFWIITFESLRLKTQEQSISLIEIIFTGINSTLAVLSYIFSYEYPMLFFIFKILNFIGGVALLHQIVQNLLKFKKLTKIDRIFLLVSTYFAYVYLEKLSTLQSLAFLATNDEAIALQVTCVFTVYLLICQYLYSGRKEVLEESPQAIGLTRESYTQLDESVQSVKDGLEMSSYRV